MKGEKAESLLDTVPAEIKSSYAKIWELLEGGDFEKAYPRAPMLWSTNCASEMKFAGMAAKPASIPSSGIA